MTALGLAYSGTPEVPAIPYTAVAGTGGYDRANEWDHPGAFAAQRLAARGLVMRCDARGRGFKWTTDLDGLPSWLNPFRRRPRIPKWRVGGENLFDFHKPMTVPEQYHLPGAETHMILHSHAGQLGLIAAALGLRINVMVTVCSPVREDILEEYGPWAYRNIGRHIHFYSDDDEIQIAGEFGDGRVGRVRTFPGRPNVQNIGLRRAGHNGLLYNPLFAHYLDGIADTIRSRHGRPDYLADAA